MTPAGTKYRDCFSPLLSPTRNINRNSKNDVANMHKVNQSLSIHQTSSKDLEEDKHNNVLSKSIQITDFRQDKDLEFLRIQGEEFREKIREFKHQ
jgi:hypothetical protein